MENAAKSEKYKERREKLEKSFEKYIPLLDKKVESISPSGNYKLIMISYDTGEGFWNFTKGVIYNKSEEEIFTIYRNYHIFPFQWIEHQNGNEYLLCGEDYQGYVTLNLTEKKKHVYFSDEGFKGWGFCWVEIKEWDQDYDDNLIVNGCCWGGQFEIVEYDFSNPDELPYKEVSRRDVVYDDDDDDDSNKQI